MSKTKEFDVAPHSGPMVATANVRGACLELEALPRFDRIAPRSLLSNMFRLVDAVTLSFIRRQVNGLKLEEIRARDGRTYIVMPLL